MSNRKKARGDEKYNRIVYDEESSASSSSDDDDIGVYQEPTRASKKRKRGNELFEDTRNQEELEVEEIIMRRLPVLDHVHPEEKMSALLKHDYDAVVATDVEPTQHVGSGEPMYLCKMKGISYWHLKWISMTQLLSASSRRLKNFEQAYPLNEKEYDTMGSKDWHHHTHIECILHREYVKINFYVNRVEGMTLTYANGAG